jgi:hypothetical protein
LWSLGFALALAFSLTVGAGTNPRNDFTQNVWMPARLVLDGASPYYPSRDQVDAALGQYSTYFPDFNSGPNYHAIYPLWTALAFAPFGAMAYELAFALWRAANIVLLVWGVGAILRSCNPSFRSTRRTALIALGLTLLLAFTNRETLITLIIGQFAIIELGLLAAVWGWLVSSERLNSKRRLWGDVLAGLALAVLATKPQAVGLGVLLIGLWALSRRRFATAGSAVASLAILLLVPNIFYPWSLGEWLRVVTDGQAASQMKVSASVWGVSYQWLGPDLPWQAVAAVLTLVGLVALLPRWWRDLRDRTSPVPLSLPLTLCMNSVVSPYMLGYEHVVLFLPALVLLAAVGLPGEEAPEEARSRARWRIALYVWLGVLPYLVFAVQASIGESLMEYPAIAYSAAMLALCWIAKLQWKRSAEA